MLAPELVLELHTFRQCLHSSPLKPPGSQAFQGGKRSHGGRWRLQREQEVAQGTWTVERLGLWGVGVSAL